MSNRLLPLLLILGAGMVAVVSIVAQGRLEPAEFTFNNATEIESLDPAVVTGQPEGRIIWALYEGLVRLTPDDRTPIPGIAERWEISDDGLTYTFYLRDNAKWSNGDPVVAEDFVYSMRRFLSPLTAAEYSYQAWYLVNAKRYSGGASALKPGDPVEVERYVRPKDAPEFARGEVLRGEFIAAEEDAGVSREVLDNPEKFLDHRTFVVSIDGEETRFRVAGEQDRFTDAESVAAVQLDFNEVGIKAPDERTVVMTLQSPTPYWLELVAFYPLSPVNRRCVESHDQGRWTEAGNIVTNGPYLLEFRRIRDRIRLRKNPSYWNADNVALETIDALSVQSPTTAFNLYETGQVDWIEKVPPLIAREIAKVDPPRQDYEPGVQLATYFYSFNVTRPPLDNPKVRQALLMALDRDQIVRTACAGEKPCRSLTPLGLPGYTPPLCAPTDPDAARALLAEAGFPNGTGFPRISILYNYHEEHRTIAELVRKQWGDTLGIEVTTRNEEWGTYLSSQRQLSFEVMRRSWIGDYMDPMTFLDMFVTGGGNNNTGWSNSEYDGLIAAARQELDAEKRLAILHEAEELLMREAPIMPIYYYVSRNMVRPYVRGFYNNLQDSHPLWTISIDRNAKGPNEFMKPTPWRPDVRAGGDR